MADKEPDLARVDLATLRQTDPAAADAKARELLRELRPLRSRYRTDPGVYPEIKRLTGQLAELGVSENPGVDD